MNLINKLFFFPFYFTCELNTNILHTLSLIKIFAKFVNKVSDIIKYYFLFFLIIILNLRIIY